MLLLLLHLVGIATASLDDSLNADLLKGSEAVVQQDNEGLSVVLPYCTLLAGQVLKSWRPPRPTGAGRPGALSRCPAIRVCMVKRLRSHHMVGSRAGPPAGSRVAWTGTREPPTRLSFLAAITC